MLVRQIITAAMVAHDCVSEEWLNHNEVRLVDRSIDSADFLSITDAGRHRSFHESDHPIKPDR